MDNPLVSIIIPTFNRAHLIGETLDSVLAQTYENWECIVVDDGSTDNTNEVVGNYVKKDNRFQYHERPETHKSGGNGARNYGFEISNGDYINWFDSDDLMHCERLKILINFSSNQVSDIITSTHVSNLNELESQVSNYTTFQSDKFYIDFILGKKLLITDDVLLKREIIVDILFDENLHKAQEFDFFYRLFEKKLTYTFLEYKSVYHRISDDSISNFKKKGSRSQSSSLIFLCKKLKKRYPNNLIIQKRANRQVYKTYKNLVIQNEMNLILVNFNFFCESFQKSVPSMVLFIIYNFITKRGFTKLKQTFE